MANKLTSEEVLYNKHVRDFIQYGGSRPSNEIRFYGLDAQYMTVGGVENPEAGDISPLYLHDPFRQGSFRLIGTSKTAPDLPTATVTFYEKTGAVPQQLLKIGCATFYEPYGVCKDLSNINEGATSYMMIYSWGKPTTKSLGDRSTPGDTDDAIMDEIEFTFSSIYPAGPLAFGEQAATQIDREVIDIVYGIKGNCQACDTPDVYTEWIYAVTRSSGAASPGIPGEVIYTTNGGATWTDVNITGIGASEDPVAIDIVGDKLVVVTKSAGGSFIGGYYYATINQYTGVPGTWTKVSAGFVSGYAPNDIFVNNQREIYFCADGGYIYKSTDITTGVSVINAASATTNNLLRISGFENHLVAVGTGGIVVRSINRGATWATTTSNPASLLTLGAVAVGDNENYIWVGSQASGRLYYTEDGGQSWTQKTYAGSGTGNVNDIVLATDEVLYVAYDDGAGSPTASIYTSHDSGNNFTSGGSWIKNLPTFDRANRLAVPKGPDSGTSVNNLAVAGLGGNGTDGIALIGKANII